MVKILHTSDVQLDAPFRFLGAKGCQHRKQLRDTFKRIVDLAVEAGCDLVLIAGDLFNDNRPQQGTIDFVAHQLDRLDAPICILPGNHDCYDATSVYRKAGFSSNVTVFTQQPTVMEYPRLDLAVYGNPIPSTHSQLRPMKDLTKRGTLQWHVAMAHGNLVRPDISDPPRPIHPDEIKASGMDYVALGDWHSFADYSQNGVKAYYSGAPEPTAFGQADAGYVAWVELDQDGVRVRRERVGSVSTREVSVDVSGKTVPEIADEIRRHADPALMLRVVLSGLSELGIVLDIEKLEQDLVSDFSYLRCSDHSHPQLAGISPDDFPEQLVIGKFARIMQERIQDATDDGERRRAEQALQLGVALLQGKEVL
jgi:DNA repair exonuclease SbcCD nuclease subunit